MKGWTWIHVFGGRSWRTCRQTNSTQETCDVSILSVRGFELGISLLWGDTAIPLTTVLPPNGFTGCKYLHIIYTHHIYSFRLFWVPKIRLISNPQCNVIRSQMNISFSTVFLCYYSWICLMVCGNGDSSTSCKPSCWIHVVFSMWPVWKQGKNGCFECFCLVLLSQTHYILHRKTSFVGLCYIKALSAVLICISCCCLLMYLIDLPFCTLDVVLT